MATATVTLALNQSTFLAGLARAKSSVSSLGSSVSGIGARGFGAATAVISALGGITAAGYGLKKAFDKGGGLADMSAISGRSVKSILLLRRALEDAGVSMEKIDRYILTGQDRGEVIARALKNISAADWADAAASLGKQADILDKNAATFDRVSDLLGRAGDKLSGFFVGAAGNIGKALLPILEKFDKMDFAEQGIKFGTGLLAGAQALVGFFNKPELIFKAATEYFSASLLGAGNVLIAVFKSAVSFFTSGMLQAFVAIGSALSSTLLEAFKLPIARIQAAFEELTDTSTPNKTLLNFQIKTREFKRDLIGKNMSGGLNSIGESAQADIDKMKALLPGSLSIDDRVAAIMKGGGPKLGLGEGLNAEQSRKQASDNASAAIAKLADVAGQFKIEDVMGAGRAFGSANQVTSSATKLGRSILPMEQAGADRKLGGIQVAGGDGMTINESAFKAGNGTYAKDAEFANRWGTQATTSPGPSKSKSDQLLEKLLKSAEKTNEITENAFGD